MGLLHSKTGSVVDCLGSNREAGVKVIGYSHKNMVETTSDFLLTEAQYGEKMNFLDIQGGAIEVGTTLVIWSYHGGWNQTFKGTGYSERPGKVMKQL